jgi:hypothetical protein
MYSVSGALISLIIGHVSFPNRVRIVSGKYMEISVALDVLSVIY